MTTDIAPTSFWDKIPFLKPYALLARWDRMIGVWLCFWPAIWGLTLAPHFKDLPPITQYKLIILFFIGAVAVRGAGCTINDITDRKLDAKVARTKQRPLANGTLSVKQAILFLILQLIVGAAVLFQLNMTSIIIGIIIVPLIALYPWMKRITWWPQVFLGIVFNAGALIGWAAVEGNITYPAVLLYLAGIFWTIGYDTVYAHLDAADDALIGIKSTALRWGPDSKILVGICFAACIVCFAGALGLTGVNTLAYVMLAVAAAIMIIGCAFWNLSNNQYSLGFFRLQAQVGWLLALATLGSVLF